MIAPHTLSNFQSLTKLIALIINAPHTLANFQSLPKLITLIINHFYSHCRGDWQIALTKQNFSDTLLIIIKPHYRGDWQIALTKQNELEDWLLPR